MGHFCYINKYYQKICKYYSNRPNVRLKPRKGRKKSKAHHLANSVYKGNKKEDLLIKSKDVEDIIKIIELLFNK